MRELNLQEKEQVNGGMALTAAIVLIVYAFFDYMLAE